MKLTGTIQRESNSSSLFSFFATLMQGFVGGALFGVLFAFSAWLTKPGPPLMDGILETWWFFALIGTVLHAVAVRFDSYEGLRYVWGYFTGKAS